MQIHSVVLALRRQINKQNCMRKQLISFAQVKKICKISSSRGLTPKPVACRGCGRTGRRPRASKVGGASKEWNYKDWNAV